jgi:phosphatidylglycerophosphate synthase
VGGDGDHRARVRRHADAHGGDPAGRRDPRRGLGKVKTIVQVAAIFFLIAFDPTPLWVDVLVYVAVAVTLISSVDYFFGLRRMLREVDERRRGTAESPS